MLTAHDITDVLGHEITIAVDRQGTDKVRGLTFAPDAGMFRFYVNGTKVFTKGINDGWSLEDIADYYNKL